MLSIYSSFLIARWIGFQDPHSSISHFEFCIGRQPSNCDVSTRENVFLAQSVTKTGLNLPNNTHLYATVNACNRLNLCKERSSELFMVDTSPPEIALKPMFVSQTTNSKIIYQSDKSVVKIKWKFIDNGSPIVSHTILLKLHKNGKSISESMTCGSQTDYVIILEPGNFLRDGDFYTVIVTACNQADLCTSVESEGMLIDSTPPSSGGFKFITYSPHKENVVDNTMHWQSVDIPANPKTELYLEWYGFDDIESGINEYYITISKTFSGDELSNGTIIVQNKPKTNNLLLNLTNHVDSSTSIILSIWSRNNANLISEIRRVTAMLVAEDSTRTNGFLSLMRHSCISHYCNNDCTCAVVGQKCAATAIPCQNSTSKIKPNITVFFGHQQSTQSVTLSRGCLSAWWTVQTNTTILRYEWSMGDLSGGPGEGIFNITYESVWRDIGKRQNVTHCSRTGFNLQSNTRYAAYVRAWVSADEYFTYTSSPIFVDISPPHIRKGQSVIESEQDCTKDAEYTTADELYICWQNVFTEPESSVLQFELMGGTSAYGLYTTLYMYISPHPTPDPARKKYTHIPVCESYHTKPFCVIHSSNHARSYQLISALFLSSFKSFVTFLMQIQKYTTLRMSSINHQCPNKHCFCFVGNDLIRMMGLGTNTSFTIPTTTSVPGIRYYFTVMATNERGLISSAVSDGIIVDRDRPTAGVVYNTGSFSNKMYQEANKDIMVSLQGFDDQHSYVKEYISTLIDVKKNKTVGVHVSGRMQNILRFSSSNIQMGSQLEAHVYARDAAGHASDIARSPMFTIDTTGPLMLECNTFEKIDQSSLHNPCNGTNIWSTFSLTAKTLYKFTLLVSSSFSGHAISIQIGTERLNLFLAENEDGTKTSDYELFQIDNEIASFAIESGKTLPEFNITIQLHSCTNLRTKLNAIIPLSQVGPYAIAFKSFAFDQESGIANILIGAGTTKGGFQINNLTTVTSKHHTALAVDATHGSPLYLTMVATNGAGIRQEFYSEQITIDHTLPLITHSDVNLAYVFEETVIDGNQSFGIKEDNDTLSANSSLLNMTSPNTAHSDQTYIVKEANGNVTLNQTDTTLNKQLRDSPTVKVHIKFLVEDMESGVLYCRCALGNKMFYSDI